MTSLRILLLLGTVVICCLWFLRAAGPTPAASASVETGLPASADPAAHSQYKQALDKAHAAARQMQAQRAEADAP